MKKFFTYLFFAIVQTGLFAQENSIQTSTITVVNPPPALLVSNISGPNTACPNKSILLSATPTSPDYDIFWKPVCQSINPISGNEVSIDYGSVVCDVEVWQRDRITGCISPRVTHIVKELKPEPLNIAPVIFTCPNHKVLLSAPKQNGILYHWTVDPVSYASVDNTYSNAHSNQVMILVNDISNTSPYTIDVILKREYCDNVDYDTIVFNVNAILPLTINAPTSICQYEYVNLSASGGTSTGSYTWAIDGKVVGIGTSISKQITTTGTHTYTLTYGECPYNQVVYSGNFTVHPLPNSDITVINPSPLSSSMIRFQVPQGSASYQWSGSGITGSNTTYFIDVPIGNYDAYCCYVTNTWSCISTGCFNYTAPGVPCETIPLQQPIQTPNVCNEYQITAVTPLPSTLTSTDLQWEITPYSSLNTITPNTSPPGNVTATAIFGKSGIYKIKVTAVDPNGQCYSGESTPITIDYVLDIDVKFNCDLEITDISDYRQGYTPYPYGRTIEITGNGVNVSQPFPYGQNVETITMPIVQTVTPITVSMILGNCTITKTDILYPQPVINTPLGVPSLYCEKTPVGMVVTGSNIVRVDWDFGDGAAFHDINPVAHSYNASPNLPYTVTVTAYNDNGCSVSETQQIEIRTFNLPQPNQWGSYSNRLSLSLPQVCMGNPRTISWNSPQPFYNYLWSTPPQNSGSQHLVYKTGDYDVTVESDIHCVCQAMTNVSFHNSPKAKIVGETSYCFGEDIKLYGETGETGITYQWNIIDPYGSQYSTTTPNLTFTPIIDGIHYITLTVSNANCSSTATVQVTVSPRPPAPVLMFAPGNHCIGDPPVCITSISGADLHWSNGYYGHTACFYTEGFVTAYYIDANGCKSEDGKFMICPKPNFDALLTGCYKRCKNDLALLSVYNFMPLALNYCPPSAYEWYDYSNLLSHGNFSTINTLPVNFPGEHQMVVLYGNYKDCEATSPKLIIDDDQDCCRGKVELISSNCYTNNKKVFFDIIVRVCNTGTTTLYIDELNVDVGYTVVTWSPKPLILIPGECGNLIITVVVDNFDLSSGVFTLIGNDCDIDFTVPLDWSGCLCDSKIDIKKIKCSPYSENVFELEIDICNTGTTLLRLNRMNVSNGYSILSWFPAPLTLNPGQCKKLYINVRVDDLTQTAAFFTLFNQDDSCFIAFKVPIDTKQCKCKIDVKELGYKCFQEGGKIFYDIRGHICNTGTETLYFDNLIVSNGYTIKSWSPYPLILAPGQCENLQIIVEVNSNVNTQHIIFTMIDRESGCRAILEVPLEKHKCICDTEIKELKASCFIEGNKLFFDIWVEICNTGETPLHLDNLNVFNGCTIKSWSPNPLILNPGQCDWLHIVVEVNDFTQTSAIFTLYDNKYECYTVFTIPLDWSKCMCDTEIKILEINCKPKDCKFFYDIEVEICNTGTTPLYFDNLNVNNGYTIHSWQPKPFVLQPGQCDKLSITVEVNDFSQLSALFTLFDIKDICFVVFTVPLNWKECMERCEFEKFDFKFNEKLSNQYQAYFDFDLWLPGGTTDLLGLWIEPPILFNYNYYPPNYVNGTFMFDYNYLRDLVEKDEYVCIYAVVCIDKHILCFVEICIPAKYFLENIKGAKSDTSEPEKGTEMIPPKKSEILADNVKIYPNPAKDRLFIINNELLTINNVEIVDLAGKTIANHKTSVNSIDVSALPQGIYLVKIHTDKGLVFDKFIKR